MSSSFVGWLAVIVMVLAARTATAQGNQTPVPQAVLHADSVLDLATLEREVVARNPSLAAMHAAVREARARVGVEGALENPMVDVMVAPQSFGRPEPAGYRIDVDQPIPWFGTRGLRREAAAAEADASQASFETARLDLIREARAAFYDDYHYDQVRRTLLDQLELVRQSRQVALSRYAAGTSAQQDVLDADVDIAMLEHQTVAAGRSQALVETRLRSLLHLDALTPLPSPPDTVPIPETLDAVRLVARADTTTRPELRVALASMRAAQARIDLARRERLPEPALGVVYDQMQVDPDMRWSVRASLALPIAPGRRASAQHEAEAQLEGARARHDAANDAIQRAVADAATEFSESLHELEVIHDALLPATERAVASARARYESGKLDFTNVLAAARARAQARLEFHRVLGDANQARADLERALGGPRPTEEVP